MQKQDLIKNSAFSFSIIMYNDYNQEQAEDSSPALLLDYFDVKILNLPFFKTKPKPPTFNRARLSMTFFITVAVHP